MYLVGYFSNLIKFDKHKVRCGLEVYYINIAIAKSVYYRSNLEFLSNSSLLIIDRISQ